MVFDGFGDKYAVGGRKETGHCRILAEEIGRDKFVAIAVDMLAEVVKSGDGVN